MSCSGCGSTEKWYLIPETGQVRCPGCFMTVPAPAEKTVVKAPAKPAEKPADEPVAKPVEEFVAKPAAKPVEKKPE